MLEACECHVNYYKIWFKSHFKICLGVCMGDMSHTFALASLELSMRPQACDST